MNVEKIRAAMRLFDQAAIPPTDHRLFYDPETDTMRCTCGATETPARGSRGE